MSTIPTYNAAYSKYDREYFCEIVSHAIYSALFCAIQYRKEHSGLTQNELARRCGKDKSQISKMLNGPAYWNLRTVAETAFALDLEVEFTLVDKTNSARAFTASGVVEHARSRRRVQIVPSFPAIPPINQFTNGGGSAQLTVQGVRAIQPTGYSAAAVRSPPVAFQYEAVSGQQTGVGAL